MKKTINENTLRTIIRESMKNYLKESIDSNIDMIESDGWTPDMDDMWDEFGNNNIHDTEGAFGVLAQGDEDDHLNRVARSLRSTKFDTDANMNSFDTEPSEFASDDNAEYFRDKMMESAIDKAIEESLSNLKNDDYDFSDKSRWCGDAKFHAANKKSDENKVGTVKLNESQLKKIISETVMNILNEIGDTPKGQKLLGMAARRAIDNRDNAKARNIKQYSDDRREEDAKKMSGKSQWRQNRRAQQMKNSVTDGFFGKDSSVGIYRDKE